MAVLSAQAGAAIAAEATSSASGEIADIVVTAQRRSESIQNVPITIQALTSETLSQLSVTTFDDMAKYLPNVALSTNGPAQGNIFMRGLALGSAGTQSSGTIGLYPNVAVYLDEQSGQLPSRNLDIYAADLERIEVLEGPQGTLFGGGAQAGVVRYITNKPKLNKFEGSAEAMYGTTAHGDPNSGFTAVLNLPLVTDHLAIRAVLYNEDRGGYINNVPSTFTRRNTDLGIYYANFPAVNGACPDGLTNNGSCVPTGSPVANNYAIAKNAINPVTYQGGRLSALWQINDDWNVLLSQTYQDIHADGVFYQMPRGSENQPLNNLEVTLFAPSYNTDKFSNTSLTINGKIGPLQAVYAGGYLVRNVDQVQDYTNYARGVYADYYQCYGPGSGIYSAAGNYAIYGGGDRTITSSHCNSPVSTWREQERNTHQSHEFRVSAPNEWPLRFVAGAFYEDLKIYDQTDWAYKSLPNCTGPVPAGGVYLGTGCMGNIAPLPGVTTNNPNTRNDTVGFFEDTTKGYTQFALFGSVDYDIIPKVLTITGGIRHYDYKLDQKGWVGTSFGCFEAPSPCYGYGHNMDAEKLNATYTGNTSRGNLTWHITPDAMVYYTFSQGYRPGGFNRTSGYALPYAVLDAGTGTYSKGAPQYQKPLTFSPDKLTNNEVGFKTELLNHRLQINGSVYKEDWKNVQTGLFNPGVLGNLTLAVNGADYEVKGAELQVTARPTKELSVIGSISYNDAKQTASPCLRNNIAGDPNIGECINYYYSNVTKSQKQVINALGTPGTPTAYSPKVQANLRARYDWTVNDYNWFGQVGAIYVGEMYNNTNTDPSVNGDNPAAIQYINTTLFRFRQPAYTTYDASFGVAKDAWSVMLFGQNLGNSDASTFTSTAQFIETQVPVRPRVLGVRVGMKF
ncbi:MAG: TonB-dependent receptor [Proteobacteria bacterium]|nr:TonB-dependent receptor [Pseudomonadota bacterium]